MLAFVLQATSPRSKSEQSNRMEVVADIGLTPKLSDERNAARELQL